MKKHLKNYTKARKSLKNVSSKLVWHQYWKRLSAKGNFLRKPYKHFRKAYKIKGENDDMLPCPFCLRPMLKSKRYHGHELTPESWNIDHIDENFHNNSFENYQPMHVDCNRAKGDTPYSVLAEQGKILERR